VVKIGSSGPPEKPPNTRRHVVLVRLKKLQKLALTLILGITVAALPVGRVCATVERSTITHGGFMTAEVGNGPLLYISNPSGSVNIYRAGSRNQSPIGQIADLESPGGLSVDRNGNLWVYDNGAKPVIKGFHRGSLTAFASLQAEPGFGLAVDRRGTIYAATSRSVVQVYARGSKTPTKSLVDPGISGLWNVAVDGAGNVFVNGFQYVSSETFWPVDEIPATSPAVVRLMYLGVYGGLAIARGDSLVVSSGSQISVFEKPYRGSPTSQFSYPSYYGVSLAVAVGSDGNGVWSMVDNDKRQMWAAKFNLVTGFELDQTSPQGIDANGDGVAVDPAYPF